MIHVPKTCWLHAAVGFVASYISSGQPGVEALACSGVALGASMGEDVPVSVAESWAGLGEQGVSVLPVIKDEAAPVGVAEPCAGVGEQGVPARWIGLSEEGCSCLCGVLGAMIVGETQLTNGSSNEAAIS